MRHKLRRQGVGDRPPERRPGRRVDVVRARQPCVLEQMLEMVDHFEPEEPLQLRSGDLTLTATAAKDDPGAAAKVARRPADGTWLRALDMPEIGTGSGG